MTEITAERYAYAFDCLPPIFINQVNGQPAKGYCITEAYDYNENGVVLQLCIKDKDGKFYEGLANVLIGGKYVDDAYYSASYLMGAAELV